MRLPCLPRGRHRAPHLPKLQPEQATRDAQPPRLSPPSARLPRRGGMSTPRLLHYDVLVPRQSERVPVFTFAAPAADIARFARIERAGRDGEGTLQGFQRPQIAGHIREIRDYLEKPTAILAN